MNDLAELTSRLAPAIAAVVDQEVARREGVRELERRQARATRDAKIQDACLAVAEATDRLEQARFAGALEIPARRELEKACKALCKVMRGRPR